MSKEEAKGEVKVKRNELTVVAEDTNWRKYVATETKVAQEFNENWGFLTKDARGKQSTYILKFILLDGKEVPTSLADRIADQEAALNSCSGKLMQTSNCKYGRTGVQLEMFNNSVHNIEKSADLMPQPRRPAKKA